MFGEYKEALDNTCKIADMCNFDFEFGVTKLPKYILPNDISSKEFLYNLVQSGFTDRINNKKIVLVK
jgi:DNA polymerase-3 subunit alpha